MLWADPFPSLPGRQPIEGSQSESWLRRLQTINSPNYPLSTPPSARFRGSLKPFIILHSAFFIPGVRRMQKAAETPCKQRAFRDPPRTPAGPLPDPFPSNTPAEALPSRLGGRPSFTLIGCWMLDVGCCSRFRVQGSGFIHPPQSCPPYAVLLRRTGPPANAVGASAHRRAGAPALTEVLPSRLGGRRSDESEAKAFGEGGFDHNFVYFWSNHSFGCCAPGIVSQAMVCPESVEKGAKVLASLKQGEEVIQNPGNRVHDGQRVTLVVLQ